MKRFGDYLVWVFIGIAAMWLSASLAHGQVVNDPSKASQNTEWMQKQADKGWLSLPKSGTYYINDWIKFPCKIGGRITTKGYGTGYWYPGDHPSKLSDQQTRICQLKDNKPIFLLCGAGVVGYSPLVLEGRGNAAAVEIEGRAGPVATGRHRFANWSFYNWQAGFKALPGYYKEDGAFVKDENHADNCSVTDCEYMNCERIFWSQSEQAVNWYFRGSLMGWVGNAPKPVCAGDIERGGKCHFDGLEFCTSRATVFRLGAYSPNNCYLTCRDLSYDRQPYPNAGLTLVEYAGPAGPADWKHWGIVIEGMAAQKIPDDVLYRVPADLPRDKWDIALLNNYQ